MFTRHFFTMLVLLVFGGVMLYRVSWLQTKKVFNLTLQQLMLLVLVPAMIFPMMISYLLQTMQRPPSSQIVIPDGVLVNLILLSMMFIYGSLAIHSVTKLLTKYLQHEDSEAERINRYFHLNFSHNLGFGSALMALVCITLLELNHVPTSDPQSLFWGFVKGLGLGLSFFFAMSYYTKYIGDVYQGRWADLKGVFLVMWVGFVLLLYGITKVDPSFREYQLLVPTLISFGVLGFLNVVLVIRRVKRGWQVYISQKKLRQSLQLWEDE